MTLTKTSLLNGLAVLARLATQLLLTKVLAVHVGTAGFGLLGQFQNFVTMVMTLASGAVNVGVTKYTAEYWDDAARQRAVWSTAGMLGLIGSAALGVALIFARRPIANWTLGDDTHATTLIWLAGSLTLLVFNALMLAILNGRKAVGGLVIANIAGSLMTAAVATTLVATMGLEGALLALCVSQALAFFFTAWIFARECAGGWRLLIGRIDPTIAKRLGGFALMATTSALVTPLTHLLIRSYLADQSGWSSAGLWQAVWKISEMHLMLITTTLSVYFLPRFSEIRCARELRREVLQGYRFVLPLVIASSLVIYAVREPLVRLALTSEFLEVTQLLGLQLLGDVLKIGSWVMAFTMLSHARTRAYIITELVFAALLFGSTVVLVNGFGLQGSAAAYALTYLVYWVTMYFMFNDLLRKMSASTPVSDGRP